MTDFDSRTFEVVALGCNIRASAQLEYLFEKDDIKTFQFLEYFLTEPLSNNDKHKIDQRIKEAKVFFPFLSRLINRSQFIPGKPSVPSKQIALTPQIKSETDRLCKVVQNPVRAEILPLAPHVMTIW